MGLSGCTSEPSDPLATASSSAPATTAPSLETAHPTARPSPVVPANLDREDVDGAAAAATYVVRDLYPYVYETGDLAAWRAISAPGCQFCARTADEVEELHARGGRRLDGLVTVESIRGWAVNDGTVYAVDMTVTEHPWTEVEVDGTERGLPGGAFTIELNLVWQDGWRLEAADVREAGA